MNDLYPCKAKASTFSVVGGRHSIAAIEQYEVSVNLTSTGGGALVRYLSGEELPAIKSIEKGCKTILEKINQFVKSISFIISPQEAPSLVRG